MIAADLVERIAERCWEACRTALRGTGYAFLDVPWAEGPEQLRDVQRAEARAALAALAEAAGGQADLREAAVALSSDATYSDGRRRAIYRANAHLLRVLADAGEPPR